jgi:Rrf2 family iron-sulfur cluster assembly transcriptional regulator
LTFVVKNTILNLEDLFMKLSTRSRYGVRAIFDIAFYSNGLETQVKRISQRQKISPRYLEQIFQKFKKAGIAGGKRGPSGGYFLRKDPAKITVGEIIRVTEGDLAPVPCERSGKENQSCDRAGECVAQIIWKEAGNRLNEYFDSVTIEQLCRMAQDMGLRREPGSYEPGEDVRQSGITV